MTEQPCESSSDKKAQRLEIIKGVGLLVLLHVIFVVLAFAATAARIGGDYAGVMLIAFIGFTQFVYVIPALVILWRIKRSGLLKGLLIGAAITLLITGTCSLLFRIGALS